jgi:hypothetical protein
MRDLQRAAESVRAEGCPVCAHQVAVALFDGDVNGTALDVVRCVDCGHAFNVAAPASDGADSGSRPFSSGPAWREHVRAARDETLARLPSRPVVIEVGYGDAQFLGALAEARPAGRYVGFDPHGVEEPPHAAVELRRETFSAVRALAEFTPDLIVARYVMEHLAQPLGFVQELAFAAACAAVQPVVYLEMPCLDRALETGRTFDFAPEHVSYFTTPSLMRMLSRCGVVEQRIGHGYQKDVIYTFARLGRGLAQVQHARAAEAFRSATRESLAHLKRQIDGLAVSGRRIAIWGASGEAAAFIAQVATDARRVGFVVDTDPELIGKRVPATGHEIRSPQWLSANPVDVVIIPAARRARHIVREMVIHDVRCDRVLVESRGRLIDYVTDARAAPHASLREQGATALAS